jgi:hypothetical protein
MSDKMQPRCDPRFEKIVQSLAPKDADPKVPK